MFRHFRNQHHSKKPHHPELKVSESDMPTATTPAVEGDFDEKAGLERAVVVWAELVKDHWAVGIITKDRPYEVVKCEPYDRGMAELIGNDKIWFQRVTCLDGPFKGTKTAEIVEHKDKDSDHRFEFDVGNRYNRKRDEARADVDKLVKWMRPKGEEDDRISSTESLGSLPF